MEFIAVSHNTRNRFEVLIFQYDFNFFALSDMVLDRNKSYFENLREVVKMSVKHNLGLLRKPVDPDSWTEHQVGKHFMIKT